MQGKLEGEEAYEACDKMSRLAEFEAYLRYTLSLMASKLDAQTGVFWLL